MKSAAFAILLRLLYHFGTVVFGSRLGHGNQGTVGFLFPLDFPLLGIKTTTRREATIGQVEELVGVIANRNRVNPMIKKIR